MSIVKWYSIRENYPPSSISVMTCLLLLSICYSKLYSARMSKKYS